MTKTWRAAAATVMFLVLLVLVYVAHITFMKVDVVFYAAIFDGVLAAALAGIGLVALDTGRVFVPFEKALLVVIWLLVGYVLAISVPTVIDRSLSLYILEKLHQRGGGIRQDRMRDVFTQEYLPEHRLVDVRLTEQVQSGTIVIEGGCVKLTDKGARIASFSRFFRQHLLPKQRLLMGAYSDDLTDPFRHSGADPGYECQ